MVITIKEVFGEIYQHPHCLQCGFAHDLKQIWHAKKGSELFDGAGDGDAGGFYLRRRRRRRRPTTNVLGVPPWF